jgi:hypothetical protein
LCASEQLGDDEDGQHLFLEERRPLN